MAWALGVANDEADLQAIGGVAPKEGEAIVVGVLAITAIIQFIRLPESLSLVEAFKAKVLCMYSQQVSDTSSPPGKVSGQSKLSSSSSLSQPVLRKLLLWHAQGQGGNL